MINPYPARLGFSLDVSYPPLNDLPEEERLDLTQNLSIHTPPWPSYMPLGLQYFKRLAGAHMGQGANGQIMTTSNHVGTHMDGEIHFHPCGRAIGQVPLDEWYGPGAVVDISDVLPEPFDQYFYI